MSFGAGLPGINAVVMMISHVFGLFSKQRHFRDELIGHYFGVTVGGMNRLHHRSRVSGTHPHGFDLFRYFQTGIKGTHDGAQ